MGMYLNPGNSGFTGIRNDTYVDKGGILERGTHQSLLNNKGAYYDLYMAQYDFLA